MSKPVDRATAFIELCRRDPHFFRSNLQILGPDGPTAFSNLCVPFQKEDFDAIDPALKYLAGVTKEKPHYQMFYFQRSRGASKTTDRAMDILYLSVFAVRKLDMIIVAEDKEQAQLLMEQVEKIVQFNGWITNFVEITRSGILNKTTKTRLKVMTADVASSYGITPDVVLCDEWSHWTNHRMFSSLLTSFVKTRRDGSIFVISTNAGEGTNWKWEAREAIRTDPDRWYFSCLAVPPPWYTADDIAMQKKLLPSVEFRRLVLNEWVESGGEYITLEEADACVDDSLEQRVQTVVDGYEHVAALDFGEKIDRCVGVVGHVYDGQVLIDRMDVIDPKTCGGKIPVSWCRDWMREIQERFGGTHGRVVFVVDRHQLISVIEELRGEGFDIVEFQFAGGQGNYTLSRNLAQMIHSLRVKWYPGCGTIYDENGRVFEEHRGRNDLCTELASCIIKKLPGGMWRLDHNPGGHDDRVFALGALCLYVTQNCSGFNDLEYTPPMKDGSFRLGHAR